MATITSVNRGTVAGDGTGEILYDAFGKVNANDTALNNQLIASISFNTGNGVLTLTKEDASTFTVDLDGRYLQSETSHADVLVDGDFTSQGIMLRGATSGSYSILTDNSTNWNTAFSWGDHALAGYQVGTPTLQEVLTAGNSATSDITTTGDITGRTIDLTGGATGNVISGQTTVANVWLSLADSTTTNTTNGKVAIRRSGNNLQLWSNSSNQLQFNTTGEWDFQANAITTTGELSHAGETVNVGSVLFDPSASGNAIATGKGAVLVQATSGTPALNGYSQALSFSRIGTGRRGAAIAFKQTTADADQGGIAFFTKPDVATATDVVTEQMVLDESGNLSLTSGDITTTGNITAGSFSTGGSGTDVLLDNGTEKGWSASSVVSTIAARNSSGDINCRLIRQEWADESGISGGMVYRINNSTNNYLRVCNSPSAIRTFLDVDQAGTVTFDGLASKTGGTGAYTTTGTFTGGTITASSGGVSTGSQTGATTTDLSKHFRLWGTTYGFNVTSGTINVVTAGVNTLSTTNSTITSKVNHDFSSGIDVTGNITTTGTIDATGDILGPASGGFYALSDGAASDPSNNTSADAITNVGSGCKIYGGADNGANLATPANANICSWYGVAFTGGIGPGVHYSNGCGQHIPSHLFNCRSGDLVARGDITAFGSSSDIRLKKDIEPIYNAVERLETINGVNFTYKDNPDKPMIGVIAQELLKDDVLKKLVYETGEDKHYAVRYEHLTAILIEAVKELSARVKELEDAD